VAVLAAATFDALIVRKIATFSTSLHRWHDVTTHQPNFAIGTRPQIPALSVKGSDLGV